MASRCRFGSSMAGTNYVIADLLRSTVRHEDAPVSGYRVVVNHTLGELWEGTT
jgi:hypothetical protein